MVTALLAGLMAVIADGRLIERAGLVGHCTTADGPVSDSGARQACRAGWLEGRPDLSNKSCVSEAIRNDVEYWLCPASVVSSQTPRG